MKAKSILKILSLLLVILSVILMFTNPKPENNLQKGFFTPIIAFEFIKTKEAVVHFFDVKDAYSYKAKMLTGNAIDYGFMCVYSALLFFVALQFKRLSSSKIFILAAILCFVMLLGDALENLQIYHIIQTYKDQSIEDNLYLLQIFTWLKWASIASVFAIFSLYYFQQKKLIPILNGIAAISCLLLAILAFILQENVLFEVFALSVVVNFLLTIVWVFWSSRQENKKSA